VHRISFTGLLGGLWLFLPIGSQVALYLLFPGGGESEPVDDWFWTHDWFWTLLSALAGVYAAAVAISLFPLPARPLLLVFRAMVLGTAAVVTCALWFATLAGAGPLLWALILPAAALLSIATLTSYQAASRQRVAQVGG
jgi:hypothetical protein